MIFVFLGWQCICSV